MAKSEASVSTPKGISSSMALTTACAMSFLRSSNAGPLWRVGKWKSLQEDLSSLSSIELGVAGNEPAKTFCVVRSREL